LWLLGYPDQALRLGDEGLAILDRSAHGFTHSRGLYWNSVLHACRREWQIVEERSAAAIASAQERGLAMVVAVGRVMRGVAQGMLDPDDAYLAEIRGALAAYRTTGARLQMTYHLVLLAQALANCGRHGEGLGALREAAALAEGTDERFAEVEIHRVKGNLLRAENSFAEAEACYMRALEVARAQKARSLELRAAADLARLWVEQDRRVEAHDLLARVYGWFTEGFDTVDLKEAKMLLNECGV
jgi:predicted ATPase